ncbi:unnamed protein product [Amoebophrya sp. A25]|nr:unnamed protein product [Amoebophrya sp. A25]|eukprot:GSA25T00026892001.1
MTVDRMGMGWDTIVSFLTDKLVVDARTGKPLTRNTARGASPNTKQEDRIFINKGSSSTSSSFTRSTTVEQEKMDIDRDGKRNQQSAQQDELPRRLYADEENWLYLPEQVMLSPAERTAQMKLLEAKAKSTAIDADLLRRAEMFWNLRGYNFHEFNISPSTSFTTSMDSTSTDPTRVCSLYPTVGLTHHRTTTTGISIKTSQSARELDRLAFWTEEAQRRNTPIDWKATLPNLMAWSYDTYLERLVGLRVGPGNKPPPSVLQGLQGRESKTKTPEVQVVEDFWRDAYRKVTYTVQNANFYCLYNAFGDGDSDAWMWMRKTFRMFGTGWGETPRGGYKGTVLVYKRGYWHWVIARYSPYYPLLCSLCDAGQSSEMVKAVRLVQEERSGTYLMSHFPLVKIVENRVTKPLLSNPGAARVGPGAAVVALPMSLPPYCVKVPPRRARKSLSRGAPRVANSR